MTFSERLLAARLQRGLTQRQVANAVGLDQATVSGYETGYSTPTFSKIQPLCRVLGVSSDWLLDIPMPLPQTERQQADYRDKILRAVCLAFDVRQADVLGKRRHAMPTAARHAAMWLMIEHIGMTMVDVGRYFEGRDHSTVCNARANVLRWAEYDAPLWARVEIAQTILGQRDTPAIGRRLQSTPDPTKDTGEGDRASTGRAGASNGLPLFQTTQHAEAA
jgi:transcriptional regulator with XRE-family HTH domain